MKDYYGIREEKRGVLGGVLHIIDFVYFDNPEEAMDDFEKYSNDYTYAEWSDRACAYVETVEITDIKVWLLRTMKYNYIYR
jgi:hypothetical protein